MIATSIARQREIPSFFALQLLSLLSPIHTTHPTYQSVSQPLTKYTMSSDQGRFNPKLPGSYQPVMNEENFNAPAHHLNTQQAEQVVELAEASAGHIQTGGSSGGAGGFGSGSLGSELSFLRSKATATCRITFCAWLRWLIRLLNTQTPTTQAWQIL